MGLEYLDTLKKLDIPTALRICVGTDGSVTYLLEVITKNPVEVVTQCQEIADATPDEAALLMIRPGDPVNHRKVLLTAAGIPYVSARSITPLKAMPSGMKDDLMRADIPIGRILRKYKMETRRDILNIEKKKGNGVFKDLPVLSREYFIIHDRKVLMWINELFPMDDRWEL